MSGTWEQVGPGRSVFRPAGADDGKIPEDALLHLFEPAALAVLRRLCPGAVPVAADSGACEPSGS